MRRAALIVTFDEAESDSSAACCSEPSGPNTPMPGIEGPGGGRTGTLVLSSYVTPGSTNDSPYNHYALLRSIEDLFRLPHLGYAAGLRPFGADVFNATPAAPAPPHAKKHARKHRRTHRRHHRHKRRR